MQQILPGSLIGTYKVVSAIPSQTKLLFKAAKKDKQYVIKLFRIEVEPNESQMEIIKKRIDFKDKNLSEVKQIFLHKIGQSEYLVLVEKNCENSFIQILTNKSKPLSKQRIKKYMIQIAKGISYFESKGVLHNNLNLSNILYSPQSQKIKLISDEIPLIRNFVKDKQKYLKNFGALASLGAKGPNNDVVGLAIIFLQMFGSKTIEEIVRTITNFGKSNLRNLAVPLIWQLKYPKLRHLLKQILIDRTIDSMKIVEQKLTQIDLNIEEEMSQQEKQTYKTYFCFPLIDDEASGFLEEVEPQLSETDQRFNPILFKTFQKQGYKYSFIYNPHKKFLHVRVQSMTTELNYCGMIKNQNTAFYTSMRPRHIFHKIEAEGVKINQEGWIELTLNIVPKFHHEFGKKLIPNQWIHKNSEFPICCLGTIFWRSKPIATGILLERNLVLTCARAVYDREGRQNRDIDELQFVIEYKGKRETCKILREYSHRNVRNEDSTYINFYFALLILNRQFPMKKYLTITHQFRRKNKSTQRQSYAMRQRYVNEKDMTIRSNELFAKVKNKYLPGEPFFMKYDHHIYNVVGIMYVNWKYEQVIMLFNQQSYLLIREWVYKQFGTKYNLKTINHAEMETRHKELINDDPQPEPEPDSNSDELIEPDILQINSQENNDHIQTMKMLEEAFGTGTDTFVEQLKSLAIQYFQSNKYIAGVAVMNKAIEVQKDMNHPAQNIAHSYLIFGQFYQQCFEYKSAIEKYTHLDIQFYSKSNNYKVVGIINQRLGNCYNQIKQFPKAELYLKKAVEAFALLGTQTQQYAQALYTFAVQLLSQSKLEETFEKLYQCFKVLMKPSKINSKTRVRLLQLWNKLYTSFQKSQNQKVIGWIVKILEEFFPQQSQAAAALKNQFKLGQNKI